MGGQATELPRHFAEEAEAQGWGKSCQHSTSIDATLLCTQNELLIAVNNLLDAIAAMHHICCVYMSRKLYVRTPVLRCCFSDMFRWFQTYLKDQYGTFSFCLPTSLTSGQSETLFALFLRYWFFSFEWAWAASRPWIRRLRHMHVVIWQHACCCQMTLVFQLSGQKSENSEKNTLNLAIVSGWSAWFSSKSVLGI